MEKAVIYTIGSVIVVSLISFVGAVTLVFSEKILNRILLGLVSLSAGTLFGGAFLHLIPEAVKKEGSFDIFISFLVLSGIIIFFLLDKLIHWKHSHKSSKLIETSGQQNKERIAHLNLLGDGIHNFADGLVIAGSYLISIPAGIATTIAVIVHETPQEIADFGVLIYAGLSKKKALLFNFASATLAIAGAIIGLTIGAKSEIFLRAIVPFASGAFVYIAGSNLIPELFREELKFKDLIEQFIMFILGIVLMYGLLFLE